MTVMDRQKPLPGPKQFYGLKNFVDLRQAGMLQFLHENWQEYGDLFEIQMGPKKLVAVIHPDHVRHVAITNGNNYEKLESYDGVRKYITGDGVLTSTGDLWKRQRRLMAPFYTPRGVEEFSDIMLPIPYLTHRHPVFWDEPLRFNPDRHAPDQEKERHPQAYHPFAAGKRICLGNHFSLLETHIMLAILAHRFDPQLLPGYEPKFTMEGLLHIENGLPMVLRPRNG